MKTKLRTLPGLLVVMLLLGGTMGAWAQSPYPFNGAQTRCITGLPEPYGVINTVGSTYAWTIDNTVTSVNWTLNSNGANTTTITWVTPGIYIVQVVETTSAI